MTEQAILTIVGQLVTAIGGAAGGGGLIWWRLSSRVGEHIRTQELRAQQAEELRVLREQSLNLRLASIEDDTEKIMRKVTNGEFVRRTECPWLHNRGKPSDPED